MSEKIRMFNKAMMILLVFLILETVGVYVLAVRPLNGAQIIRGFLSILVLLIALGALFLYEKRGRKDIAVITLGILSIGLIGMGVYNVLKAGGLASREGAAYKLHIGPALLGILFGVYVIAAWLSKSD